MDTIEKAKEAAFKAAYDSLSGADYDEVRTAVMIAIDAYDKARPKLHFVFDAFPSPEGSRLIEVEDDSGCSVSLEWASRNDGNVELCVNSHASLVEEVERLREALRRVMDLAETEHACLQSWNKVGGPLDYEGIMAMAREVLNA